MRAPVSAGVLVGFAALAGALAWHGFTGTEVGLKVSDFSNVGSYQRGFALILERDYTLYPAYLFIQTRDVASTQQVQLDAVRALMGNEYVDASLPMDSLYWLGDGPASLMALYNASGPGTPVPADAFYVTLDVWLLGLGAPSAPNLWCYDSVTNQTADCFDRLPPAANKNIRVGAARGLFNLIRQRETSDFTSAIVSTRAALDPLAAAHGRSPAGAADAGFRLYATGYTYNFFEQYLHIWGDLYALVGYSLLGVFAVTLLYQPQPALAACVCAVILAVTLEVFGLMSLYGVRLNAFSATNLAVSAGMSTELSVHYAYAFLGRRGARRQRAAAALAARLEPEAHGMVTSVLALLFVLTTPLAFVHAYYFGMLLSVSLLAFLNGVVLLPVLMGLVGPLPAADPGARIAGGGAGEGSGRLAASVEGGKDGRPPPAVQGLGAGDEGRAPVESGP